MGTALYESNRQKKNLSKTLILVHNLCLKVKNVAFYLNLTDPFAHDHPAIFGCDLVCLRFNCAVMDSLGQKAAPNRLD